MTSFLVESYRPRSDATAVADLSDQARVAAQDPGSGIVYVSSILVEADETCFHVFEASSADAVVVALRRAGISCDRITEAIVNTAG
jgi:hypothetical protein